MIEKKMTNSMKSSVVSKKLLSNLRPVNISSRQDHSSRVGVKSKLSCSNVAKPNNCLSWYVALKSEDKISRIPQIKWKCPPKFALNSSWLVAAGEESQETVTQKVRETVLEVVYPDLTSIPPSLSDSAHMEIECSDNPPTPIIPMIPIEELDAMTPMDTSTSDEAVPLPENLPVSRSTPSRPQDQTALEKSLHNMLRGLEKTDLEVAVAAAATVAAVMEKKEQIDTELLIKFLTNPDMLKKLLDANSPTPKPENKTPPPPDTNTSLPLPSPKPILLRPTSKPENKTPPAPDTNIPLPLPSPKPVPKHSKPVKKSSPLPSPSPRHPPIGNLPVMKQVRSHIPYSSTSDEEIERLVNKYLAPDVARVRPVRPLNPPSSIPNREVFTTMIHQYGRADETMAGYRGGRGWGAAIVGPRPVLPAPAPLPPVTNHALWSNFTAPINFHFSQVTTPAAPNVGFNYCNSLIKQHGVMHEKGEQRLPISGQAGNCLQGFGEGHYNMSSIEMNPKNGKPCAYFRSTNGCRDGYKCRYMHDGPGWRDGGAMEFPESKRMKFTEQIKNWR